MNKKLMLLAAAALSALALAVLPTLASAEEYEAHCRWPSGLPKSVCEYSITGGFAELSDTSGLRIHCKTVGGTGQLTSTTSTGTAILQFKECTDFVFGTECNNQGAGTKQINTNTFTSHLVNIDPTPITTPGILLTAVNVTFSCPAIGVKKTVTGNIIGHMINPGAVCNKEVSTFEMNFQKAANGQQTVKQVTTTGTIFDLISNNDAGGSYLTSAQTGLGTIHILNGDSLQITC
ncbi:MAG TPA: hypothetical protein VNC16_00505 [Solirubrobacterales bacterium]|jgi:hypothetical protein|nr:hypothetical protein [Solirubrobacterales bacterium]